jgi:murein L,D-transpeptidase YcbB/YkuD
MRGIPLKFLFISGPSVDFLLIPKTFFLLCLLCSVNLQASTWDEQSSHGLEELIKRKPSYLLGLDDPVIEDFYRERKYKPLWLNSKGLHNRANDLLHVIINAGDEGLKSSDYYLEEIQKIWGTKNPDELAQLDLLLSVAFYSYSKHAFTGRFKAEDVDDDWHIGNRPPDARKLFARVAQRDSIAALLKIIPPQHSGYQLLKERLRRYREIEQQGGWQNIEAGPAIEPGMQHEQVVQLRQRLHMTGDLDNSACCDSDNYDAVLVEAVKHFQARHGLAADGEIGPKTLSALNVTVDEKIRQILLNMERWRWMPRELGKRYLVVNMSGFELYMVENDSSVLAMPVIVGKSYRSTPSFSGWVSYMEYNPYWTIPRKLALEDIVPKQVNDPSYLSKRLIKVFRGWENAEEIDPQSVNWSEVDKDSFPYWLRQEPGPRNALGRIKFIFSNPYKVYLHGTPDKHLFNRVERAFSSGCIRVRDPVRLAAYLLGDGSLQKEEEVLANIHLGSNDREDLPASIPIYLVYWTAWVDEDGGMNFRHDIYDRDTRLRALFDS